MKSGELRRLSRAVGVGHCRLQHPLTVLGTRLELSRDRLVLTVPLSVAWRPLCVPPRVVCRVLVALVASLNSILWVGERQTPLSELLCCRASRLKEVSELTLLL